MPTAEDVLRVARSQIGTVEAANGANKYGAAYGMDRVAWCAQFVWWCFREAGASSLIMQKTAYTPTLFDWYRKQGRSGATPQVGALVFYNWPSDGVDRIQHVGIVEAVEPGAIVTVEGNTSDASAGNGGRVLRRRRARNSSIVGYGYPAYAPASPITPSSTEDDELDATQARMLAEIHDELTKRLPSRVDYKLLGLTPPQVPVTDTCFGMATNGDARSFEARELAGRAWSQARQNATQIGELAAKVDQLIAAISSSGQVAAPLSASSDFEITLTGTAVPRKG
jgi:hypothetical protein